MPKLNYAERTLSAMSGPSYGVRAAWSMFMASYSYSRSWDGVPIDEEGKVLLHFGRIESFCEAIQCGWRYLWKRNGA